VIAGGIILAFVCWGFTFGWSAGNFWVKIGLSVCIVLAYSLLWQRPTLTFRLRSLALGVLSAATLYLVFLLGNALSPFVVPKAPAQVAGIYVLGLGSSRVLVFLLLLFVTGPGEEVFWRGFLQSRMMARLGDVPGYLAATGVYAAVHVFSGNLVLTLAALVAGAFWGALYLWRRDLVLLMVSHSLWSAVIFAVAPIR
jgi:membrane protease YdiL (CAAX protease family)